MSTQAVATQQRTFNPTAFKRDFQALAQMNPKKATVMAADWRERLENAVSKMEGTAATLVEFGTVGLATGGFSTWLGWANAKRADMIDRWRNYSAALAKNADDKVAKKAQEYFAANPTADPAKTSPFKEGKLSDPTSWGLPLSLWIPIATGGVALATRNYEQVAFFTRSIFMGGFGAATADLGQNMGARMYKNGGKAKKKDNN